MFISPNVTYWVGASSLLFQSQCKFRHILGTRIFLEEEWD